MRYQIRGGRCASPAPRTTPHHPAVRSLRHHTACPEQELVSTTTGAILSSYAAGVGISRKPHGCFVNFPSVVNPSSLSLAPPRPTRDVMLTKATACDADMRLSYCPVYCACSCHVVPDVRAAAVMWQPGAPLVLLLLLHGWIVGAENLSTKLADRCANQACTRLCAHARSTWHLAFDRGAHHPVGVCAGIGKHAI